MQKLLWKNRRMNEEVLQRDKSTNLLSISTLAHQMTRSNHSSACIIWLACNTTRCLHLNKVNVLLFSVNFDKHHPRSDQDEWSRDMKIAMQHLSRQCPDPTRSPSSSSGSVLTKRWIVLGLGHFSD